MTVAALYDIHGNLPALEAVLHDVRRAAVDEVVVGGDIVPGPLPRESLAALLALPVPVRFIHGNGDREVLQRMRGIESDAVSVRFRDVLWHGVRQLQPDFEPLLASWPATLRLSIDGVGEVLFCHATPRSDTEIVTRLSPDERLLSIFGAVGVPLVVCGHTHMQFDIATGGVRIVNAGSVGMSFQGPGAYWLLLGPGVELRRTMYDATSAADRIRSSTYPEAADFAERHVVHPPTEQATLDAFARAEPGAARAG